MNANELASRFLINKGYLSAPVLQQALARISTTPQADLLQVLVEQQLLSPEVAQVTREAISRYSSSRLQTVSPTQAHHSGSALVQSGFPSEGDGQDRQESLGGYILRRELGAGGMGTVYAAFCPKLRREVALKQLKNDDENPSLQSQERFRREAESMAQLNHPNIVSVHDFGEENGVLYLVMDLIKGRSLKEIIREQGPLEFEQAAEITRKVALALDYIHRRAILHRDVKPANIMITEENEEPLLTDFGLAKDENQKEALTKSFAVLGTPVYMSPEQADGNVKLLDQRADIYSLGASLYEMLTGRALFSAANMTNLMTAILTKDPTPISSLRSEVPPRLESIVTKCLEKEAADRYFSAFDLAQDLQDFLTQKPEEISKPSVRVRLRQWSKRRQKSLRVVRGLLTVLILAALAFTVTPWVEQWFQQQKDKVLEQLIQRESVALQNKFEKTIDEALISMADDKSSDDKLRATLRSLLETEDALTKLQKTDDWLDKALKAEGFERSRAKDLGLLQEARSLVKIAALRSKSAYLRAKTHERLKEAAEAESARAKAYEWDPKGYYGSRALLDWTRSLIDKKEYRFAEELLEPLKDGQTQGFVLAQSQLMLLEIYLKTKLFDQAAALAESIDKNELAPEDRPRASWFSGLALQLRGTVSLPLLDNKDIVWSMTEKGRNYFAFAYQGEAGFTVKVHELKLRKSGAFFEYVCEARVEGAWRGVHGLRFDSCPYLIVERFFNGQSELVFHRFLDRQLEKWKVFPGGSSVHYRFGDVDGNGQLDIVHGPQQRLTLSLNVFEERQDRELRELIGSYRDGYALQDIDGDGSDEIIVGAAEWQKLSLFIYRGLSSATEGLEKPFTKLMGVSEGFSVIERKGRPGVDLLIAADRQKRTNVGIVFGADESPDVTDTVWRLSDDKGKWRLQALKKSTLQGSRGHRYWEPRSLKGLLPDYPKSFFYMTEHAGRWFLNFNSGQNLGDIEILLPGRIPYYRLLPTDEDNDVEFLTVEGKTLTIFGLKSQRRVLSPKPAKTQKDLKPKDQLDTANVFLQTGDVEKAAQLISSLIESPDVTEVVKAQALMIQSEVLASRKEYKQAREACLSARRRSPLIGARAMEKAAEYSEKMGDYDSAIQDLIEHKRLARRDQFNNQRFRNEMAQLRELKAMKTVVALDRCDPSKETIPIAVYDPLFFQWQDGRLEVDASRTPAKWAFPLRYQAGSFRMRGTVKLESLDPSTALRFSFSQLEEGGSCADFGFFLDGNGDQSSWGRHVMVYQGLKPTRQKHLEFGYANYKFKERLGFELVYERYRNLIKLRYTIGGVDYHSEFFVKVPFHAGRYELSIETPRTSRFCSYRKARLVASVEELILQGSEEGLKAAPELRPLSSVAGGHFLAERYEKAAKAYESLSGTLKVGSEEWVESVFLQSISDYRRGKKEIAVKRLNDSVGRAPQLFNQFWVENLFTMIDSDLDMLCQAFSWNNKEQLQRIFYDIVRQPNPATEILALINYQLRKLGDNPPNDGVYWMESGHFKRARRLLEDQLARGETRTARVLAGVVAFRQGRYQESLEYWRDFDEFETDMKARVLPLYVFARIATKKKRLF